MIKARMDFTKRERSYPFSMSLIQTQTKSYNYKLLTFYFSNKLPAGVPLSWHMNCIHMKCLLYFWSVEVCNWVLFSARIIFLVNVANHLLDEIKFYLIFQFCQWRQEGKDLKKLRVHFVICIVLCYLCLNSGFWI